ncbi:polynucleotide kinase [Stenotrophomonas phage YB07]|uniref:3'-phosphatase n=1 Tax=Stenotrophomonas phage YB07 TaxID=2555548 RepID=A0A482IDQ7_9CAUD|nr:polynucleotide kinase [Stenotrophomonas phage YB07]QBP06333.1 polynucleotide kinase [Stenotrophomonas phage YB07]
MKAFITVGVSCSGKTTWAEAREREFGDTIICRDDIRWDIMRARGLIPCWANWKWKDEKIVNSIQDQRIEAAARDGLSIVIADTNLNASRRAALREKLESLGYNVQFKIFDDITLDEALRRDAARLNGVGAHIIHKQWVDFNEQFGLDRYEPVPGASACVIVDIDGTVAIMRDRSAYDWSRVGEDDRNTLACLAVKAYHQAGIRVVFVSGRDAVCEPQTRRWLKDTFGDMPFFLFMRGIGDQRKDTIIKREIFDLHIRDNYNVLGVLDDRPSVARMWRDLGLNVVQFGNPYVEF